MAAATEQNSTSFNIGHLPTTRPTGSRSSSSSGGSRGTASHKTAQQDNVPTSTTSSNSDDARALPLKSSSASSLAKMIPSHLTSSGQRRPSFSITLPPSKKDGATVAKTIVFDDIEDHRHVAVINDSGSHEPSDDGPPQQETPQRPNGDPPVRRRSVQFMPGDEDALADHEHQSMMPKTPYPTTENPMEHPSSQRPSSPFVYGGRSSSSSSSRSSPSASSLHLPHPPDDHAHHHHHIVHHAAVSPPSSASASSTSSSSSTEATTSVPDKSVTA